MTNLPAARTLHRKGQWPRMAHGRVTLTCDARFIRRKRLVTAQGEGFLIDLADTVSLMATRSSLPMAA